MTNAKHDRERILQEEQSRSWRHTAVLVLVSGACCYLATEAAWALCFPNSKVSLLFPPRSSGFGSVAVNPIGPKSSIRGFSFPLVSVCNFQATAALHVSMPVPSIQQTLIAIVDDDESVCRALRRLIRSMGMTAETYICSTEFVDLIEARSSFRPDCVVLDVQMPSMNGIEVQACLRRGRGDFPINLHHRA